MKWFKNAYDRAETAEYVLRSGIEKGLAEEYHPGFRRTSWSHPALGALAIMNHYPRRMVFNRDVAYDDPINNPFYRVQLGYYSQAGEKVSTLVEFDSNFAYLKRSSEYVNPRPTRPNEMVIWDEAMAVLDESLLAHATLLGQRALPPVVELAPVSQFVLVDAA